ncbi:MAG: thermonuclease family protein [Nanoarchaeota archaeon]
MIEILKKEAKKLKKRSNVELFIIGVIIVFFIIGFVFLISLKSSNIESQGNKIILSPKQVVIVDGDTIKFKNGTKYVYVRIVGIDTPEYKKEQKEYVIEKYNVKNISCLNEYGILAKEELSNLIKNSKNITIIVLDKDRYGRILGKVMINGSVDVAEILVKEGYAFLYTKDKYYKPYLDELYYAKDKKEGLWGCIN